MLPTHDQPVSHTYRGMFITLNRGECGEVIYYVETPEGPIDVADMKAARQTIDNIIAENEELPPTLVRLKSGYVMPANSFTRNRTMEKELRWVNCEACGGSGEIIRSDRCGEWDAYEYAVPCGPCEGTGRDCVAVSPVECDEPHK